MGTFCEAFEVTKIEAPSTILKRIHKKKAQTKWPSRQLRPFIKSEQTSSKLGPKKKASKKQKKPIVCYKCGKTCHKSYQCKTEQKINELFFGEPELQKKLHALLIQDKSEEEVEYYSESSEDSEYESSPIPTLNVLTNKSQKEFLLDLIGQIPDGNLKREYLEKLKSIILEEEDRVPRFSLEGPSSSLTNIYKQFPIPNPFQEVTTKELQTEINELKTQVRYLKAEVINLKFNDSAIEAKLAIIESQKMETTIPPTIPLDISGIPETEVPTPQFLQTISKLPFKNGILLSHLWLKICLLMQQL